jgi:hypothetical protein
MLPACFWGLNNAMNEQAARSAMLTEKLVCFMRSPRALFVSAVVFYSESRELSTII